MENSPVFHAEFSTGIWKNPWKTSLINKYRADYSYVTTPVTVIDKETIWFGEPLSSADFISEGNIIETEYFPCLRFVGKHTARMIKAIFEIPTLKKGEK